MPTAVSIKQLSKTYASGTSALRNVSLDIEDGEILALLGPNGAGKTTLISIVCGITTPSSGEVTAGGHDVVRNYRKSRQLIGLVPQEIALDPFERVGNAVRFSRRLFGAPDRPEILERILRQLSLWEKRDARMMELSGGMKRRVMIAKALSHEPRILFLDEPTAGVDVELRQDMWEVVRGLKADGVTIILTTHYIEEAEAIADRIGVVNKGELLLVEDKVGLMRRMGRKRLRIDLQKPVPAIPESLADFRLEARETMTALCNTTKTPGEVGSGPRLCARESLD